jgi:very-short-patch-repair endonuclease
MPGCWEYNSTGARIGRKIPDFIHTSKKKLIEYFGYQWHTKELGDDEEVINYYRKQGYDCLVVWYDELLDKNFSRRILNFERA